jgi:transcriptional regulator GlxA family with amidase domain
MAGQTPLEYLTTWRIIKAVEMLAKSNHKISEVAVNVGYQSEAAFSRIFKSKVSQTRSAF